MVETIAGMFASAVTRFPDRTFIRWIAEGRENRVTYGQMAVRVAATLEKLSMFAPGDRVMTYLDDLVPTITFMLAAAHAGVVVLPVAPGTSLDAVRRMMARVEAKGLFTTPELAPTLASLDVPRLAYVSAPTAAHVDRPLPVASDLTQEAAASTIRATADVRKADDAAFILPTSGSTGEPKLVVISHRYAICDGTSFALGAGAEPPQRVLMIHTLHHAAGLFHVHMAMLVAGELCIPSRINVETPLDEVRKLDPTHMGLTPRVLRKLYRDHVAAGELGSRFFGPSLQVMVVGGSAVEVELLRYVAGQNVSVVEGYGTTESGLLALTPRGAWREGWIGKPLPGVTFRVAEDGELLAKPAAPMTEYLHAPDLTREAFTDDGYYRTGDFGEISDDGYVRIFGRKKDVFNTFDGANIYPARLELLLEALPWVKQVVLVGDQRPHLGALIVLNDPPGAGAASDGYLDAREHRALYERARRDIQTINAALETNERTRRIALFARPFSSTLYVPAQQGKIRRDRKRINDAYSEHVDAFYAAGATPDVASVPDA